MKNDIRRLVKRVVPMPLYRQVGHAVNAKAWIETEGFAAWRQTRPLDGRQIELTLRSLQHPITFRRIKSHVLGITQNVLRREYDKYLPAAPRVIVDAGAFIGDLSCHWATKFSSARIISLEPNQENFELAARNVQPYGDRITLLNKGLWSHACRLKVHGDEMESYVQETDKEDYDVDATDVPSLLKLVSPEGIEVLKLDVEGAEAEILNDSCAAWIDKVGCLVVECHGAKIEASVVDQLTRHGFQAARYRSLLTFTRPA